MITSSMRFILYALFCIVSFAFAAEVTILGINDMHAEIDKIPQLATCIEEERARDSQLLLLSAGDNRTGNPYVDSGDRPGFPMIQLMNQLRFNASALGNHEFDSGGGALRDNMEAAQFPFICANFCPDSNLNLKFEPYRIYEVNGVKVCVLGLVQVCANGLPDTNPGKCHGMQFISYKEALNHYKELRQKCDILILLTHVGIEADKELAEFFPEADAIIGGHTHTRIEDSFLSHGVLITQAENKLKYITRLSFTVEDGRVTSKSAALISLQDFPPHPEYVKKIEEIKTTPHFKRVIARATKNIESRESLGCLMADAIRDKARTDFAIVNIGNVRLHRFGAGDITVGDVYKLDPFGNDLIKMTVTGRELITLLQRIPVTDHHGAPCVSGLKYKAVKPAAKRTEMTVLEAYSEDGKAVIPEEHYTLVLNSYLCSTVTPMPEDTGISLQTDGAGCLIDYLLKRGEIDYSQTSRVELITQD